MWRDVALAVVVLDDGAVCLCRQVLTTPDKSDDTIDNGENGDNGDYANVDPATNTASNHSGPFPPLVDNPPATPETVSSRSRESPAPTPTTMASWRTDPSTTSEHPPATNLVYHVDVLHWHCTVTLSVASPPVHGSVLAVLTPADLQATLPRLSFFALGTVAACLHLELAGLSVCSIARVFHELLAWLQEISWRST